MTELPKRFTKDEVLRSEAAPDTYGQALWVDIPDALSETQVLGHWRIVGPTLVGDRTYRRILDASDAIYHTASDDDISLHPYRPELFTETQRIQQLVTEFEADPIYAGILENMREILAESTELDWVKFERRIKKLGQVANSRTPLYVAGDELWLSDRESVRTPGFAGPLKGMVTIKQDDGDNFTVEPLVEGKDGSVGLFPAGVFFQGLYAVHETKTYDKKFLMERSDEITAEEKAEADADYIQQEVAFLAARVKE